ncbi:MAG: glycosyltransferase [Blastocatellia bacterium]
MARIVLSTMGSLGDLHPMTALGLELRNRGHSIVINTWEGYREKIAMLGFDFVPLRPNVDPEDREFVKKAMDGRDGSAIIIREMILPFLDDMYADLTAACVGADMMITGELLYVSKSVHEKTGIKWVTTCLSPLTLFSFEDPGIYPGADFLEHFRPLPAAFHRAMFSLMRLTVDSWFKPYRRFRKRLGLDPEHDPIFFGKFSDDLHLVMFSRVLAERQPDWPEQSLQTGFCFYDGQEDEGKMPDGLREFLDAGDPPVVFTLGSAAVMDARDFFDESAKAAKQLGRRAVLLYGRDNIPPKGLDENIVGFEYAPYSLVFSRAACVVHQGGVGTTGQVLRAGVPHLIMPFGHDQPDNAARCRRIGVGETISRDKYRSETAASMLDKILSDPKYSTSAREKAGILRSEGGTIAACNEIEKLLS